MSEIKRPKRMYTEVQKLGQKFVRTRNAEWLILPYEALRNCFVEEVSGVDNFIYPDGKRFWIRSS